MKFTAHLVPLVLVIVSGGCSTPEPPKASASAIHLEAALISTTDIRLTWNDPARNIAGHIVEWATEPEGEYSTVAFTVPEVTSFVHPDLITDTKCYYRIRPYIGPTSGPVEITTGKALPEGVEIPVNDDTWAEPKTTPEGTAGDQHSVRDASTISAATPTSLQAKLIHPTGIQFTWIDHAGDEDGYMLEMKGDDDPDFRICALMGPNVTSYGYGLVPSETKLQFRVRAFYYGAGSNIAYQKTGKPELNESRGAESAEPRNL